MISYSGKDNGTDLLKYSYVWDGHVLCNEHGTDLGVSNFLIKTFYNSINITINNLKLGC